jgi:hypothetical protein
MKWFPLALAAGVLVGCDSKSATTKPNTAFEQSPTTQPVQALRTTEQFQFLQSGMATSVITNQVGPPDRQLGSGQMSWEYDLSDGSRIVIVLELVPVYFGQLSLLQRIRSPLSPLVEDPNDYPDFRVGYFSQYRGTNRLWTKPEDYK